MADDGVKGFELWESDGSESGTKLVKDIYTGSNLAGGYPKHFAVLNTNILLFQAQDGTNGYELWKTDGTESGTSMVKDIRSGSASSSPEYLIEFSGKVYFRATTGVLEYQLWKTDGDESGTEMVKDLSPRNFFSVHSTLYFFYNTGSKYEVWKTDGSSAGTTKVMDASGEPAHNQLPYVYDDIAYVPMKSTNDDDREIYTFKRALKSMGEACTADNECSTNICKSRCCDDYDAYGDVGLTDSTTNCDRCNTVGECESCVTGMTLIKFDCSGHSMEYTTCGNLDNGCPSFIGSFCASQYSTSPDTCCKKSSAGDCVIPLGSTCTSNEECESGTCLYRVDATSGTCGLDSGSVCSLNEDCHYGICKTHCCSNTDEFCHECDDSGGCGRCYENFAVIDDGGHCNRCMMTVAAMVQQGLPQQASLRALVPLL